MSVAGRERGNHVGLRCGRVHDPADTFKKTKNLIKQHLSVDGQHFESDIKKKVRGKHSMRSVVVWTGP